MDDVTLEFQPPAKDELQKRAESGNRYERRHAERLLTELEETGQIRTEFAFPVQAAQFGDDLTLVALPGEVVVDSSLRLKRELGSRKSDGPRVWIAGYSNHVFGYLPSRRVLREGGYEGGRAMIYSAYPGPFTESVEERVVDKVRELAEQVRQAPAE